METYSTNSENNFKFTIIHPSGLRRGLQAAMFVLITSVESAVDRRSYQSSLNLNFYLLKKNYLY